MPHVLKMAPQLPSVLFFLQILIHTVAVAAGKPTEFRIAEPKTVCPFNVAWQVNQDLSALEVVYTSKHSALASVGHGETQVDNHYECLAWMSFYHSAHNTSLHIPSADVEGTVSLGEGVVAKVTTSIFWDHDQRLVRLPPKP
jgi:hypothetical protein